MNIDELWWAYHKTKCRDCENCRWDPEKDCGKAEHPHCERCGHCSGRHGPWMTSACVDEDKMP